MIFFLAKCHILTGQKMIRIDFWFTSGQYSLIFQDLKFLDWTKYLESLLSNSNNYLLFYYYENYLSIFFAIMSKSISEFFDNINITMVILPL